MGQGDDCVLVNNRRIVGFDGHCLFKSPDDSSMWTILDPDSVVSEAGASFERLSNGSFLVTGPHEERDIYSIRTDLDETWITAIRLDLVADERLPNDGPGRHETGNFHLAEISLKVPDETSKSGFRHVPFEHAWATYAWPGRAVLNAIDGNRNSVWHVYSKQGMSHTAIFFLRDPITAANAGSSTAAGRRGRWRSGWETSKCFTRDRKTGRHAQKRLR
jgi:hypothetical protein